MRNLAEMQFELLESEDTPEDGYAFGIGLEESVNEDGFDPGGTTWVTQDSENSVRGFTQFGVDKMTGPTWAWQNHVDRYDTPSALETIGRSQTAWRNRVIAQDPGAVTAMRYRLGHRIRRVYGRPRAFTYSMSNRILGGYVPITKDFKCFDAFTYDDLPTSHTLNPRLVGQPKLVFPVVFPIAASVPAPTDRPVLIGGDAVTYPVITFRGPIANPYLQTRDWTLQMKTSIAAEEFITVDLRPWHLSILRNGTQPIPGAVGRGVWLEDMFLEPGDNQLFFGGTGNTSGATCTIEWRSCWNSL